MIELGLDVLAVREWFPHVHQSPYVLVRVKEEHVAAWATQMGTAVRRCYVADVTLTSRASDSGQPQTVIIAAKLPDAGAVMAGDFGEILCYLYLATTVLPSQVLGPKKWRLKQDRTKPAPHSDVVQFVLPAWPLSTDQDSILCAEVKTKSTRGNSTPIANALADCNKDRTSRLARTLVWLRERALVEDIGPVAIAHLDRFLDAAEHPPAKKIFRAVAVVCEALAAGELQAVPATYPPGCGLVVIVVPQLHAAYSAVFAAAKQSLVAAPSIASPLSA